MPANKVVESYLLEHDLRPTTADYYRRVWSVFRAWLSEQPPGTTFSAQSVSQFLLAKQIAGRSPDYRRSLRNGLVALLRHRGDTDRVRPVKLRPLEPECWTTEQVVRLVATARQYRYRRDPDYWPTLIEAAYYTGLCQVDLETITRVHIAPDGTVCIRRSRTGKRVVAWLPTEILASRPGTGPLWPRQISAEMFRRHFAKIVTMAGLAGTFKRLRKSSGTAVEQLYPGRGHEHLANSRAVFERHYLAASHVPPALLPPRLRA